MKVLELDQKAALRICSKGAPLKRAQEVLKDLVSWARTGPTWRESSPESLMHSTSQREIVSLEAALWGAVVVTKRSEEERSSRVRLRYHLRALTGHQSLSSWTEGKEAREGRKTSTDPEGVWFLAIKEALGISLTPEFSQRKWPGSIERAWRELRRWPEATARRKTVFKVRWNKEALWRGSKGEEVKERSTKGRLQEGIKDREGGRFRKNDFKSLVRKGELETVEPSGKPAWKEAMADL